MTLAGVFESLLQATRSQLAQTVEVKFLQLFFRCHHQTQIAVTSAALQSDRGLLSTTGRTSLECGFRSLAGHTSST